MRIAGYCRFSWFGISDTGRAIQTEADAARLLYDPARLATRMHLFEHLTAPSLRQQSDPDFDFVVLTSPELPAPWLARLRAVAATVPQMRVLVTAEREIGRVMKPLIREATEGGTKRAVSFRLDDDDALSWNYVATLRRVAAALEPGTLITFPSGIFAFSSKGQARFGPWFKEYHAYGLARVNGPGFLRDPFDMQHRQEYRYRPSFMEPRFCSYIATAHDHNNTRLGSNPAPNSAVARYLRNAPEIAEASHTARGAALLAAEFPFLSPEALLAILAGAGRGAPVEANQISGPISGSISGPI